MHAAQILQQIQEVLEALDPTDQATPEDRFHGNVGDRPAMPVDRMFSVGASLPARDPNFIDPTEYVMTVVIAVAYMSGPSALARCLDDAEQVNEAIWEMAADLGVTIDQVGEGQIHAGPELETFQAVRQFRVRYTLG